MAKVRLIKAVFRHLNKNMLTVKVTVHVVKKTHCSDAI